MKLQPKQIAPGVTLYTAELGGQTEQIVCDTATGTKPVALQQYVLDQGGTRPIPTEPRGPDRGGKAHD